ncbi:MAG: UDP-2,3-diacylglucosamine diphosphatase [Gammaproteobacteria bacterium]|nr:UDP-2,3-diacylglucosamine diphosphatase [Gammaproteobacteria bacterium]
MTSNPTVQSSSLETIKNREAAITQPPAQASVQTAAYTLVIADIHLQPEADHPINLAFKQFLVEQAPKAEALYILGDLFEMWVGDDIGALQYSAAIQQLNALTDSGTPVYIQFGNRDFLMRKKFWQATGATYLKEPYPVTLYGTPYLMLHGDALCTDDKAYQRLRRVFRSKLFAFIFLGLCHRRRLAIGNKMRQSSQKHSQNKSSEIMDVNASAVLKDFSRFPEVQHMIHGHTHRPAHHIIQQSDSNNIHTKPVLNRWVLGDWRPDAQIIKISHTGIELLTYPEHSK